ncbi:hypothetical protein NL676_000881 [Syzygium grande]|nr:hypothetical protein NL676_000881 [Syzygium grande]
MKKERLPQSEMDHAISMDDSETRAMRYERLEALTARYIPTPNNQQQVGDGDPNKIMDHSLYKATIDGDADKFIDALEAVSGLRKLALSSIFDQVIPSGNSLLRGAAGSVKDDVMELILNHFPNPVTGKNSSDDTPPMPPSKMEALASGSASLASARAALHRGRRLWRLRPSSANRDNPSVKRLDRAVVDFRSRFLGWIPLRGEKSHPPRTNSSVHSVLRLLQFRSGGLEFGERAGFELAETGLEVRR